MHIGVITHLAACSRMREGARVLHLHETPPRPNTHPAAERGAVMDHLSAASSTPRHHLHPFSWGEGCCCVCVCVGKRETPRNTPRLTGVGSPVYETPPAFCNMPRRTEAV